MTTPPVPGSGARADAALDAFVARHAAAGDWPGAVYAAGPAGDDPAWLGCAGRLALVPEPEPARIDACYDLASLTKPLALAAVLVRLADRGLDLDRPLDDLLPELSGYAGRTPSFADLLLHRSGLPAWAPLYRLATAPPDVVAAIASLPPVSANGCEAVYSCLGPIVARFALERATGTPFERLFHEDVAAPLGLAGTLGFAGHGPDLVRCAPTEAGRVREAELAGAGDRGTDLVPGPQAVVLRGIVHDGNAAFLGGVSGNAGLFGTAAAVFRAASALAVPGRFVSARGWERLATPAARGGEQVRTFGFQSAAGVSPAGGFGPLSFGHAGFTGTSVWIAPAEGGRPPLVAVLLSNRIHPHWTDAPISAWRREFHELVAARAERAAS